MSLPLRVIFQISIALLWVASFASSTRTSAATVSTSPRSDKKTQASLAGVQGMFWNLGKILATGMLVSGMERVAKRPRLSCRKCGAACGS